MTGFRSVFPRAFLYKTALPTLALFALALGAAVAAARGGPPRETPVRRMGVGLVRTAPLWLVAGVYAAAVVPSKLNIGLRHLLPIENMGYRRPPGIGLPKLVPGLYCVSATRLQQVYFPPEVAVRQVVPPPATARAGLPDRVQHQHLPAGRS